MALTLRWASQSNDEAIVRARWLSFGYGPHDLQRFSQVVPSSPRIASSDVVLAEEDGQAVGSATAIPFTMWVRSSPFPCQGVGLVGTIFSRRRSGGIASKIMNAVVNHAREKGQVLALLPFRPSFYEHFGYGLCERRCAWTVPLTVMPEPAGDVFRMFEETDWPGLCECRQRIAQAGQCDIERSREYWEFHLKRSTESFLVVDPDPARSGVVRGYIVFSRAQENAQNIVRISEMGYEDIPGLVRLLRFLGTLRDQHSSAQLTLPGDVDLNWLLKEKQIPEATVNHPAAHARAFTRMQVRILDSRRLLDALHLPAEAKGQAVVAVKHVEQNESRFRIDIADGRAQTAETSASSDIECGDAAWATMALGHMTASQAARLGLLQAHNLAALKTLDALAAGPCPFTLEGF